MASNNDSDDTIKGNKVVEIAYRTWAVRGGGCAPGTRMIQMKMVFRMTRRGACEGSEKNGWP